MTTEEKNKKILELYEKGELVPRGVLEFYKYQANEYEKAYSELTNFIYRNRINSNLKYYSTEELKRDLLIDKVFLIILSILTLGLLIAFVVGLCVR